MTDSPNVELVRSICRAWERGDYSSADWAHPETIRDGRVARIDFYRERADALEAAALQAR
jgi:ketosteroid isomerase-like protein